MDARKARSVFITVLVVVIVALVAWQRERGPASPAGDRHPEPAAVAEAPRRLPRVVDVGAGTCKACKEMLPILAEVEDEYDGRALIEVIDIREDGDALDDYDVRLIPTQIFFDRDGREVWRHEGFLAKEEIVRRLDELGGP